MAACGGTVAGVARWVSPHHGRKQHETVVRWEKARPPKIRGNAVPHPAEFHPLRLHKQTEKGGRQLAGMNGREGAKYYMNNRKIAFNYVLGLIVKLWLQNLFMFHGLLVV